MSHTKLMSSPSRHSPTMITSTEGGGGNISHLTHPPYGLSHKPLNTVVTLNKIPPNIADRGKIIIKQNNLKVTANSIVNLGI